MLIILLLLFLSAYAQYQDVQSNLTMTMPNTFVTQQNTRFRFDRNITISEPFDSLNQIVLLDKDSILIEGQNRS